MRALPTLLLLWLGTGLAAVVGSILGNALGTRGLQVGAIVGGVLGVLGAVAAAGRLGWLPRGESGGAIVGALIGFAAAAAVTLTNLHTPIIPVLSCGLVGVGALLGAGVARGLTGG